MADRSHNGRQVIYHGGPGKGGSIGEWTCPVAPEVQSDAVIGVREVLGHRAINVPMESGGVAEQHKWAFAAEVVDSNSNAVAGINVGGDGHRSRLSRPGGSVTIGETLTELLRAKDVTEPALPKPRFCQTDLCVFRNIGLTERSGGGLSGPVAPGRRSRMKLVGRVV